MVDYNGKLLTNKLGITNYQTKTWHYSPNERTRHSKMEGQTVRMQDDFEVTNEVSNFTEYGKHPHATSLSCANSCYCYCYLTYSNAPLESVE